MVFLKENVLYGRLSSLQIPAAFHCVKLVTSKLKICNIFLFSSNFKGENYLALTTQVLFPFCSPTHLNNDYKVTSGISNLVSLNLSSSLFSN